MYRWISKNKIFLLSLNPIFSPRAFFGFVTSVPVISSSKPAILFCAPFYRAVSELLKQSSSVLETRTVSRDCGLCPCNLLAETNNPGLGAGVLSSLFPELQVPPSPGLEPRIFLRSSDFSKISSWFQEINMWKFGANWCMRSRAFSEHNNHNFNGKCKKIKTERQRDACQVKATCPVFVIKRVYNKCRPHATIPGALLHHWHNRNANAWHVTQ
jgi:hypothetical protein